MAETKRSRKYTIRRATPRDLPELKRMRIALQDLLIGRDPRVWRLSPELTDGLEEFYSKIMEKDQNRIFVAIPGENGDSPLPRGRGSNPVQPPFSQPVAMLVVRILDNSNLDPVRFGRIDDAWVDPEWRERGVMTGLTRAAARFLAERRVSMVMLDWANNNPPSGTCWQKLGFEPLMTMGFARPTDILSRKE
jgi:ribosomal protein S18 acetylase RimI-like enzyme